MPLQQPSAQMSKSSRLKRDESNSVLHARINDVRMGAIGPQILGGSYRTSDHSHITTGVLAHSLPMPTNEQLAATYPVFLQSIRSLQELNAELSNGARAALEQASSGALHHYFQGNLNKGMWVNTG